MSDGWDIVGEYADIVASMVEDENDLKRKLEKAQQCQIAIQHHIEAMPWFEERDELINAVIRIIWESRNG